MTDKEFALNILKKIELKAYSVLGTTKGGTPGPDPLLSEGYVIVDPAGLEYIQNTNPNSGGPAGASGASGAIYQKIGIKNLHLFDESVRDELTEAGQTSYKKYPPYGVIHVVGPDFRIIQANSISILRTAYRFVFVRFISSQKTILRLLPISGGIFSGTTDTLKIAERTWDQLTLAIRDLYNFDYINPLGKKELTDLLTKQIEMCIYDESEFKFFQDELNKKIISLENGSLHSVTSVNPNEDRNDRSEISENLYDENNQILNLNRRDNFEIKDMEDIILDKNGIIHKHRIKQINQQYKDKDDFILVVFRVIFTLFYRFPDFNNEEVRYVFSTWDKSIQKWDSSKKNQFIDNIRGFIEKNPKLYDESIDKYLSEIINFIML
jgi:hypothetical protein